MRDFSGSVTKKEEDDFANQKEGKKTKKKELSNRWKKISFKVVVTYISQSLYIFR